MSRSVLNKTVGDVNSFYPSTRERKSRRIPFGTVEPGSLALKKKLEMDINIYITEHPGGLHEWQSNLKYENV